MPRNAVSFPHPVIGHGDDVVDGVPPVELVRHISENKITLSVSGLTTTNSAVMGLLAEQRAEFTVRVTCGATYFRRVWSTAGPGIDLEIPSTEVANELIVETRICARQPIIAYRPTDLHPDYGSASFAIETGDILAMADNFHVSVLHDWDPLTGPVESIVRICEGQIEAGPFVADFDSDYIEIHLSRRDWRLYNQIKQKYAPSLHSGLILPTLVEAIRRLTDDRVEVDDVSSLRWQVVVRKRLEQRGLVDPDPLQAAQLLLDEPFQRAVRNISERLEEGST